MPTQLAGAWHSSTMHALARAHAHARALCRLQAHEALQESLTSELAAMAAQLKSGALDVQVRGRTGRGRIGGVAALPKRKRTCAHVHAHSGVYTHARAGGHAPARGAGGCH